MLTNPNTLGIFEADILAIARLVHEAGGLLYYDGANLNAMLGKAKPGLMGFDIVHINLHAVRVAVAVGEEARQFMGVVARAGRQAEDRSHRGVDRGIERRAGAGTACCCTSAARWLSASLSWRLC